MKKYYFISGLPRSGSTLLSAILRQNPECYSDISSPLENIFASCISSLSDSDSNISIDVDQRKNLFYSMFNGFYSHLEHPFIFDNNRVWTHRTSFLKSLFPQTKIICCVRDIISILNSLEIIQEKNCFHKNIMISEEFNLNIFTRCEALMSNTGLVGSSLNYLIEGYYSNPEMIYICDYKNLCENPEKTMREIYNFINLDYYSNHDFNDLKYSNKLFDLNVNLKDLHTIRKKISYNPPNYILPPMIIEKYEKQGLEFWKKSNKMYG